MDPDTRLKILAHTQHVARHFIALKTSLETIVMMVAYDFGPSAPDPEQLSLFLRKEETQRELQINWETGLWRATDKSYRLVCLATPTDQAAAYRRLNNYPTSPTQCRFCWIDEKGLSTLELRPELDIYRNPVAKSFLHPHCERSWKLMRAIVEREEGEK